MIWEIGDTRCTPTPGTGEGDLAVSPPTRMLTNSDTNIWVQIVHTEVERKDGVVKQGSREIQCKDELSKWPMLDFFRNVLQNLMKCT